MIARRDFRRRGSTGEVVLEMTLTEFRETVEWLEAVDPSDGATEDWRAWLNELDPPGADEAVAL